MNSRLFVVFVCASVLFSSCSWLGFDENEIITNQPFVSLFDGGSLDQWVIMGDPAGWQVVDETIRSEGGKNGNWIRSKREYDDFILRLEFRVAPGGNSGVFVRCTEQGNPWVTGHECQISNEHPPRDDSHCTGSLYGSLPVLSRPDESPEVWRKIEILCKGTRIMVFVDNVKTVDVDQTEVDSIRNKPLKGFVGLQDSHTLAGMWVEYRNIEIREL